MALFVLSDTPDPLAELALLCAAPSVDRLSLNDSINPSDYTLAMYVICGPPAVTVPRPCSLEQKVAGCYSNKHLRLREEDRD